MHVNFFSYQSVERARRIVRQARSTQRYQPRCRGDEERLTAGFITKPMEIVDFRNAVQKKP